MLLSRVSVDRPAPRFGPAVECRSSRSASVVVLIYLRRPATRGTGGTVPLLVPPSEWPRSTRPWPPGATHHRASRTATFARCASTSLMNHVRAARRTRCSRPRGPAIHGSASRSPRAATPSRYRVSWSGEDGRYVATVVEFPSLSWLHAEQDEALRGLVELVDELTRNTRRGPSPAGRSTRGWCHRWARSVTACYPATARWSRSGRKCRSSCSTGSAGTRASSWPTPSSSTSRSSTTGNNDTRHSACSARSSTSFATPTTRPAIKQADRAKPRAHERIRGSQADSNRANPDRWMVTIRRLPERVLARDRGRLALALDAVVSKR